MSAVAVIGAIGSLALSGIGLGLDIKAQRRAEQKAEEAEDYAEEWKEKEWRFKMDERDWNRRQTKKAWKWKEDERNYARATDFVNRLERTFQNNLAMKNNLVNIWRQ